MAAMQATLRRWGAEIDDAPGVFGLHTEAAIYVLQREEGLGADGIVGPATAERLRQDRGSAALSAGPALSLIAGVPYFTQRDNFHRPDGTCNVSALAMALAFRGVRPRGRGQLEDELYEEITSPAGMAHFKESSPQSFREGLRPNTVHDMLVWVAVRRGVPATFSTERSQGEIRAEIAAGRPVVLSGSFTGSGHIVLLIGFTSAGDLICHDPWGDWMRGYRTPQGESRIYERDQVHAILKNIGSDRKWGLFVGD